jgi:hypothetical protein
MFRFGVPVLDSAAEHQEKLLEKAGYKIARTRIFLLCRTRSSIWSAGTMGECDRRGRGRSAPTPALALWLADAVRSFHLLNWQSHGNAKRSPLASKRFVG